MQSAGAEHEGSSGRHGVKMRFSPPWDWILSLWQEPVLLILNPMFSAGISANMECRPCIRFIRACRLSPKKERKNHEVYSDIADSSVSEMYFAVVSEMLPVLSLMFLLCLHSNSTLWRRKRHSSGFAPIASLSSVGKRRGG